MSAEKALPIADKATTQSIFAWLEQFAACVRDVDYVAAVPFWHSDIIVFGTYQELMRSRVRWTETLWDNVWPRTADFSFDLDNTAVLVSADCNMATVITPWTSTGFHADGRWLGIHSHMSLQRGVPQDSHGKRPVKAR